MARRRAQQAEGVARSSWPGPPDAKQIDTWLAIHADNTATVYIGFAELGQGNSTALLQIAAEELDLDMSQLKTVRLDTNITPNQGGTYSSASIARGGPHDPHRCRRGAPGAAADWRRKSLNAPVERLDGFEGCRVGFGRREAVGHLWRAGGRQAVPSAFHRNCAREALARLQNRRHTSSRATTFPTRSAGKYVYMQHVRVPGMLHGRVVRPRGQGAYGAGAKVSSVDETSIADIPGARVMRKGDFVGVVAENEWDAVRAAQQLKVTWDIAAALPGSAGLYEQMRAAKTTDRVVLERGDVTAALERRRTCRLADLPRSLSGARAVRAELRAGRRESRFRAGDVLHAGCVRHAQQPGARARHARGKSSRAVLRRIGHLRP